MIFLPAILSSKSQFMLHCGQTVSIFSPFQGMGLGRYVLAVRAPVGHAEMHCPQDVHKVSSSGTPMDGFTTAR
ncbi:MAG: hypothetical protein A4E56_01131 [Pelotomaculum sp. PtaU1.Bin065]|nr:MAG: hypothetical protein A4E56_01131 [Pelotomaculum sp. PtaU1.Bin065]